MTDFCKQLFGKSIRELTIEDLSLYFSEAKEETEILEFKSGKGDFEGAFNKNILRAVTAFLNSSGGILIWGAPEHKIQENGNAKVCVGDLVPVHERREKDQLINRIASSISYMPTGIKIERLDLNQGYIYIIEVQESQSKPHQFNGQYLIRLDGQSKPAPHYIVDSMFKQINDADTEIGLHLYDFLWAQGYLTLDFKMVVFNFSRYMPARNVNVNLYSNVGEFNTTGSRDINITTIDSISFGSFPSTKYSLTIKENVLERFDNIIDLNITSSGHNCLSKVSTYKINVDKILNGEDDIVLNDLLENIKSNIPLIDLIDANSSKEEIKRMFLES